MTGGILKNALEPGVLDDERTPVASNPAQLSIAISLKRIADLLELNNEASALARIASIMWHKQ